MNKSVNTRNNFCKCAERHKFYNFHICDITNLIGIRKDLPRIGCWILITKRNSSLFLIKTDNVNINLITNVKNIRRLLYTLPAQFRNMDHSINAANINKCAIRSHALNNAMILLTFFNIVPNRFSHRFTLGLSYSANRTDDSLTALINFSYNKTNRRTNHTSKIRFSGLARLRCRYEYACALYIDDYAALIHLGHGTFNDFTRFLCSLNYSPALCSIKTFLAECHSTFDIVYTSNDCFDGVTDFNNIFKIISIVCKLSSGDKSRILDSKININFHRRNCSNNARYQISITNSCVQRFFEHFIKGKFFFTNGFLYFSSGLFSYRRLYNLLFNNRLFYSTLCSSFHFCNFLFHFFNNFFNCL